MQQRGLILALTVAAATPTLGAAETSTTAAARPAVIVKSTTIATGAGARPLHMVRIVPGRGVRLEAVRLGGGPGRTGTVGGYIRANAGRGAFAGLNGDFFLLTGAERLSTGPTTSGRYQLASLRSAESTEQRSLCPTT